MGTTDSPGVMPEKSKGQSWGSKIVRLLQKKKKARVVEEVIQPKPQAVVTPVRSLLDNFNGLSLDEGEDEVKANFTIKTIEVKRGDRHDSNLSKDSGYSDISPKSDVDVVEQFGKLEIQPKKETKQVFVSRGPVRAARAPVVHEPYHINHVNKQLLSGSLVSINEPVSSLTFNEIDEIASALSSVDANVDRFKQKTIEEQHDEFSIILDIIERDNILADFERTRDSQPMHKDSQTPIYVGNQSYQVPPPDPGFSPPRSEFDGFYYDGFSYPTPPGSNDAPCSPHSGYMTSPNGFQHSDHETSLDLNVFITEKPHISMKVVKEMHKGLLSEFGKNNCCQKNGMDVRTIFQEKFGKLTEDSRKNLCLRLGKMDAKQTYGALQHSLVELSKDEVDRSDVVFSVFYLASQQLLAQRPELYLSDYGLNLLKTSVLYCYNKPILTRCLVQNIMFAIKNAGSVASPLFNEVDIRGDNLLGACARGGDAYANALAELLAADAPLFDVHHVNSDGYNALHLACREHGSIMERGLPLGAIRIVHVLIKHGGADVTRGDVKAGDTPLHLAVNSVNCELKLVLALFVHIDRKMWRQLAHAHNRSSSSPLEYARIATKSSTRKNYPTEVLDALKKFR